MMMRWLIANFVEFVGLAKIELMPKSKPANVDEYIASASKEAQKKLREIRAILKKVAPKATEALKWGSPVFEEKRILFAYSAFKSHLNFMPTRSALKPFKEDELLNLHPV